LADAVSRMAAQQAGPIAVARPDPTAAERSVRAVIELIVEAAMVRAVGAAAVAVVVAMVAEPPRQGLRALPVHRDNEAVRVRRPRSSARPMDSQAKAANMASIRVLTVCATAVDLKNARPRLLYQIADPTGINLRARRRGQATRRPRRLPLFRPAFPAPQQAQRATQPSSLPRA
jgi:hypothetical protein